MKFPFGEEIECFVVDVGNSATKVSPVVDRELKSPLYKPPLKEWPQEFVDATGILKRPRRWFVSGSNVPVMEATATWLEERGQSVRVINADVKLPIVLKVDHPEQVGRDRVLNALAVPRTPAVIISSGTAVTVDAVSVGREFLGGAIFPGGTLMAESLHRGTSSLPLIEVDYERVTLPAKNTIDAINSGIVHAILGGVIECRGRLARDLGKNTTTYITGMTGRSFMDQLPFPTIHVPWLTLQGIYQASRALWP